MQPGMGCNRSFSFSFISALSLIAKYAKKNLPSLTGARGQTPLNGSGSDVGSGQWIRTVNEAI
ncbi:protein of unknown function [Pararobbsia alpina]